MTEAIVVPLKRFDRAKERLRQGTDLDVARFAQDLARGVLISSQPRTVIVASEDPDVARFATSMGAEVWTSTASNLNEAVQGVYEGLRGRFDQLIIVHGDLRSRWAGGDGLVHDSIAELAALGTGGRG